MAGPIEFLSDGPVDAKVPTEYGGVAGLVQDHPDVVLSSSDKRGMIVRGVPVVDAVVGVDGEVRFVPNPGVPAVDPVTGRVVEDEWNEDGSAAPRAVDGPPATEQG